MYIARPWCLSGRASSRPPGYLEGGEFATAEGLLATNGFLGVSGQVRWHGLLLSLGDLGGRWKARLQGPLAAEPALARRALALSLCAARLLFGASEETFTWCALCDCAQCSWFHGKGPWCIVWARAGWSAVSGRERTMAIRLVFLLQVHHGVRDEV